jgi:hypothetical protein
VVSIGQKYEHTLRNQITKIEPENCALKIEPRRIHALYIDYHYLNVHHTSSCLCFAPLRELAAACMLPSTSTIARTIAHAPSLTRSLLRRSPISPRRALLVLGVAISVPHTLYVHGYQPYLPLSEYAWVACRYGIIRLFASVSLDL